MVTDIGKRLPAKAYGVLLAVGFILSLFCGRADAEDRKKGGIFGLFVENDVFSVTDGGYTNGFKFYWISGDLNDQAGVKKVPRWLNGLSRKISFNHRDDGIRFVSWSFGQSIYTPEDISKAEVIMDDRPYAGVSYLTLGFHGRKESSMSSFEFQLGIVGPHSYAGDVQKKIHKAFGWSYPRGWENQIKDELILGLYYDRREKLITAPINKFGFDAIVHGGLSLSNLYTAMNGGLAIRLGWNLPDDFGPSSIQPGNDGAALFEQRRRGVTWSGKFSFLAFFALEGHGVVRDLLLEGNTIRGSHRVEKEPFTGDIAAGFAARVHRVKIGFSYIYQTKRFKAQHLKPYIGSINISYIL